jgi:hypothetical protein
MTEIDNLTRENGAMQPRPASGNRLREAGTVDAVSNTGIKIIASRFSVKFINDTKTS